MDLKRDIYNDLLAFKARKGSHKVLELEGARQVGKTYILQQFAKEYEQSVYINMVATTGKNFLKCLSAATRWEPGDPQLEKPLHKAFELYEAEFTDTENTLIIIDEIQESAEVYSKIREFSRDFRCDFVVTGSYLGKTVEKEYFLSAGDTETLTMTTLSFAEFLEACGMREVYESIDLYGSGSHTDYDKLQELFQVYLHIGGYPEVVTTYLESGDIAACQNKVTDLLRIFVRESGRYFKNPVELATFEKIFAAIAIILLKEKKGIKDLVVDLFSIVTKEDSNRITKKVINYAIGWLYLSHQIGYCSKSIDCNNMDIIDNCRYYFSDLGMANYFLNLTGADPETIDGSLCENFVYLHLVKRIQNREIAGLVPWFGTDENTGGELDFYVRSLQDRKNYGLEVKRGRNTANTANSLLARGKLNYIYNLKKTYGGIEGRKYSVPLYLAGRIRFDLDQ